MLLTNSASLNETVVVLAGKSREIMTNKNVNEENYLHLKKCFEVMASLIMPDIGLPVEKQPLTLLTNLERSSPAKARSALSMGINDLVQMSFDLPRSRILDIDQILAQQDLLTLTALRSIFSDKLNRLIKKGKISNDVEYYLLKDVFDSNSGAEIDSSRLHNMLELYEESKR